MGEPWGTNKTDEGVCMALIWLRIFGPQNVALRCPTVGQCNGQLSVCLGFDQLVAKCGHNLPMAKGLYFFHRHPLEFRNTT